MDSTSLELSLSLKPNVPKTIPNLFKDISKINNVSERLLVLNEYLHQHQEELARIQGLKQEFPQCMLFLEDAIETLKKEVMNIKNGAESESKRSMMEESSSSKRRYDDGNYFRENPFQPCKFSDGCSSFPGFSSMVATKQQAREVAGGSTHGELNFQLMPLSQPIWKNKRRSWTPELHASFVEALEYLGGPGVATPKHIRNRMQVEGLTNDQVKSHLQKYRLHGQGLRSSSVDPAKMLRCISKTMRTS